MNTTLVIVAHGTVEKLTDLPAFLTEIRRGRPAPPSLIDELRVRYERVGGSPLLAHTRAQAAALQTKTGLETRVAMRLWEPRLKEVLKDKSREDHIILIPAAPFSVAIYEAAARQELSSLPSPPRLDCVGPWGQKDEMIEACAESVMATLNEADDSETEIVLSAHSLPQMVIDRGDTYADQFESTAQLVRAQIHETLEKSGRPPIPVQFCYQSQGAVDGKWLGPDLDSTLDNIRSRGKERVVVSPIGFLTEHIETLYDLDIEAKSKAEAIGLHFSRVPALGTHPGLIAAMAAAVAECQARNS